MPDRLRVLEHQPDVVDEIPPGSEGPQGEDPDPAPQVPAVEPADLLRIEVRGGHLVMLGLHLALEETALDDFAVDGRVGDGDQGLEEGGDPVPPVSAEGEV